MKAFVEDPDSYVQNNRASAGDLWLFLHIPKTAGTSIGSQLSAKLTPACNLWIDYNDSGADYHSRMLALVNDFIANDRREHFRFATGHLEMRHVDMIRTARPQVKVFTMLRHPVARVISDYRYQLTATHPLHKQFAERFKSLRDYALFEGGQNRMFKRLATRRPITNTELLDELEERFTFVGIQELYERSVAILGRLTGVDLDPGFHERKTVETGGNAVEITDAVTDEIAVLNNRDMAIYRHFRTKIEAAASPAEAPPPASMPAKQAPSCPWRATLPA